MKKQHAIHNEEACKFLLTSKKFNDWVVTTAFYSALHFVQNELFPLTDNGQKYTDFNVYFGKVLKKKNKKLSKHSATIELVKINLPLCSSYYRWLHDACMSARYNNYIVSESKAKTASSYLTEMKRHLKK
jgi:hypothetical protein